MNQPLHAMLYKKIHKVSLYFLFSSQYGLAITCKKVAIALMIKRFFCILFFYINVFLFAVFAP